jgi:8-oxo-(d)GTP phosphatase
VTKLKYISLIVFVDEHALHLTDQQIEGQKNVVIIRSQSDLTRFLDHFLKADNKDDVYLLGNDFNELSENFKSYFKYLQAAGGLVSNANNEFLLIRRFGIWDLPKGKLEKNEKMETCALREVTEETGVQGLRSVNRLPSTYHIYSHNNKYILKETNWFRLKTEFAGKLKPQFNEDITEAKWMNRDESIQALSTSYRSIRDILLPLILD